MPNGDLFRTVQEWAAANYGLRAVKVAIHLENGEQALGPFLLKADHGRF